MRLYLYTIFVIIVGITSAFGTIQYDSEEIHGYHFHTYFFQYNQINTDEALNLRTAIQQQINNGNLSNCRLNSVNFGPRGPHPVGSYETCCNKTSISQALSWFMLNHGNLSILLHPLTRYEVVDHTHRSMFLGPRLPLDISVLNDDLKDSVDLCLPLSSNIPTGMDKPVIGDSSNKLQELNDKVPKIKIVQTEIIYLDYNDVQSGQSSRI